MPTLSDRDREILAFEERWPLMAGAKREAIRSTFGLPAARYFQLVNAIIDKPEALRAAPTQVYALRRRRDVRARVRASRSFAR